MSVEPALPVFGYASLLNKTTLPPGTHLERAELRGWIRQWRSPQPVPTGRICALTISRRANATLQGAIFLTNTHVDANLAVREKTYVSIEDDVHRAGRSARAIIYTAPVQELSWARAECPVCLSYVDCVLQGYYRMYGVDGVRAFVATTEGWELPFQDDRRNPRYPRSVSLTATEKDIFDAILRERGIAYHYTSN